MNVTADRAVRFGAVLVLLAGYLGVYRPAEAAIAERYARLDDGDAALARRLDLARREPALRADVRALARDLDAAGVGGDRTAAVARLLRRIAARTAVDAVRVGSIVADPAPPLTATTTFEEIPLTLAIDGSYAHLIRFVRELGGDGVVARVAVASLDAPGPRSAARSDLRATLRVSVLRLAHPIDGVAHASH